MKLGPEDSLIFVEQLLAPREPDELPELQKAILEVKELNALCTHQTADQNSRRQVLSVDELSEEDLQAIAAAEVPEECARFDGELPS